MELVPRPKEYKTSEGEPFKKWRENFNVYITALGADEYPAKRQIALLQTIIGADGNKAISEMSTRDKDLDGVLAALQETFRDKTSVVVHRYTFSQRRQLQTETASAFLTAVSELATSCDFGGQLDERIRDHVVAQVTSL